MKKLQLCCLLALLPFALNAQNFEGSFLIQHNQAPESEEDENYNTSLKFTVEGDKIAMEPKELEGDRGQFGRIIFDNGKDQLTLLMDQGGQKMGIVMQNPEFINSDEEKEAEEAESPEITVTKTGETKVIAGYECKKIIVETEENLTTLWVTDELDLNLAQVMSMFAYKGANPMSGKEPDEENPYADLDIEGMPIDIYSEDKDTGEKNKVMIRDITDTIDRDLFSTEGYQMIDMDNMQKDNR